MDLSDYKGKWIAIDIQSRQILGSDESLRLLREKFPYEVEYKLVGGGRL